MATKSTKTLIATAVILLGFASVFFLSGFIEGVRPPLPDGFEDHDLALQGSKLKGFALGSEGLIADWYWMNSLQYVGDKLMRSSLENLNIEDLRSLNPRLLYPYLNNATDLDPRFMPAYSYGATVLPAIDRDEAIKLTEKGIANNPNEWRLYQYLGYIHWRQQNYERAAEVYEAGSRIGGAPVFMQMMAARMRTQGGSRDTAREMYSQMIEGARDEQTRASAELRLMELDSLDERDAIDQALKSFQEKTGRCANRWQEIIPMLRGVALPHGRSFRVDGSNSIVDPSGAPYVLDERECRAKLNETRTKIPLK